MFIRGICAAVGGLGSIGAGIMTSIPFLSGFTSAGVAAGSAAAASQAAVGNVVAGSIFSTIQSVAATTFIGTVAAPVAGAAAVVGGIALFVICWDDNNYLGSALFF